MTRAVCPRELPALPEGTVAWARSTRRKGGMYHAHVLGVAACGTVLLDRHKSEQPNSLGDFQYWGVCPRCLAKAKGGAA